MSKFRRTMLGRSMIFALLAGLGLVVSACQPITGAPQYNCVDPNHSCTGRGIGFR